MILDFGILGTFRQYSATHIRQLFGNIAEFMPNYAQYSAQFGTFRQHWAQLGTFRRFSEIILASILLLGNQTAWHVLLGFWIAIG